MEKLTLPACCVQIDEKEQLALTGGGELMDALGSFFGSMQLGNFIWNNEFVAVSFTFVPLLLFNVVRVGYGLVKNAYNGLTGAISLVSKAALSLGSSEGK